MKLNIKINESGGRYIVKYIDPITKKRKRNGFKTKKEAKIHQANLEMKFQAKGLQALCSETIGVLVKKHLETCINSTMLERKNAFKAFMQEFALVKICDLEKSHLENWLYGYMRVNNLSERTMGRVKSNFNHLFRYLVDENIINSSPLDRIKFDQKVTPRRKRVYFSTDEVKQILEDAKSYDETYFYPVIFLAAFTGARRSEILKLMKADIDLNLRLIHIRNTKTKIDRVIRMNDALYDFLCERMNNNSELITPTPEGAMFGSQRLTRWIQKFRAHYPREKEFNLHALRHSFAFNYLKSGAQMYQLKSVLGHKTIQMTIDLYGQLQAQDIETPNLYEVI